MAGTSIPILAEGATNSQGQMQYRKLGSTGDKVSIVGIGGAHLGGAGESEAIRIVRSAIDNGVNFMDNCWDYGGGLCEERMGRALRDGYRQKAFLMTKIDGRDSKTAARQIDQCLARLQTDRIDLIQFHEIIRMSDPERIFAPGGGMEAALAAKRAGKVRFIGFTGHKSPAIHLHMMKTAVQHHFMFDAVQMPLNAMDAHYDSFERQVLPVLLKHKIGVLAMKTMGGGVILNSGVVTPVQCLHYAMNLPTSVVITGCDSMDVLNQALGAARGFRPMSAEQVASILAATAEFGANGQYELYKTTGRFDGTEQHPEWLS
ncbi:MAG TPA: aldo/keto reductase [Candidatus Binataceae bacterium]|nr:aldo/keto reductase [Candidatus Binataceae bacterium]